VNGRFAGARLAQLTCPGGSFEAFVAESFRHRLLGLSYLDPGEVVPLLIPRCRSIHTFGMRTPIDLAWVALGKDGGRVLGVVEALRARQYARAPRTTGPVAALELAQGEAARLGLETEGRLSLAT
jgi:uncharacterized membrane protein (UPF0127 family)